jgi:hypothetical protein
MSAVRRMTPLYRVRFQQRAHGQLFEVKIERLGYYVMSPGRWLPNFRTAETWAGLALEGELWRYLRRWRQRKPYPLMNCL